MRDRSAWVALLRGVAGGAPGDESDVFRDEQGVERAIDPVVFAFRRDAPPPDAPVGAARDVEAWHALASGAAAPAWIDVRASGPLVGDPARISLETETELELATLHAVSRLGQARKDAALVARARAAAEWLIDHVQPDNATGTPWAAHVFVEIALGEDGVDDGCSPASAYAQTLVHNCQVQLGRADRRSAMILADAVDALEAGG